jgi:hypothetical protein
MAGDHPANSFLTLERLPVRRALPRAKPLPGRRFSGWAPQQCPMHCLSS